MRKIIGYGGKSGGGGSQATETPDSLHSISYAKVMDLVSEGEIQGLANGMQSIFFNDTPLQNPDGSYNFTGATVDFRSGSQSQLPIDGFPDVSNEHGVGVELRSSAPWVQNVTNTQLTSLSVRLGVSALSKADTSSGNIGGYQINYIIELSTDSGAFVTVVNTSFNGKTTSEYQRSHRFVLPTAKNGWTVRVTRTTANANSATVSDTTTVISYTELIDARLSYPMSALVGVQIDASQFQSIPTRSYDLLGRIIQVPSNYDPVARTYSGIWDGTLKPAWTNNPAWIFYDLLTNSRYGLGNLIPASYVDKWGLYVISQYCDQMVPNGMGGTEPRFTCNVYLQSAAEAYKVLQDLASVFRGITYWAGGSIVASADMPQDPTYTFTAANVIDGKFTSAGSAKSTRYTTATVTWNDPNNSYKQAVEYVQDDLGVQRYGVKPINVTAFGCTSQGQAQRTGQWMLLTSRLETDMLTFSVALDALVVAPGQIVRIANPNKAGVRNGGRIGSAVGRVVTLDKAPAINVGDLLTVILPTGQSETHPVQSVSGNAVTISADWSVLPMPQAVWSVDNANLVAPTYRILSITEKDGLTYEITALQHIAGKFDNIDNGTIIQNKPTTLLTVAPDLPTNLMFSANPYWVDSTLSAIDGVLSWTGTSPNYLISYRKDNDIWTNDNVQMSTYDIKSIQPGNYTFTVTAVSSTGLKSQAASFSVVVAPQLPPLPAITNLVLQSPFVATSAKIKWDTCPGATSYTVTMLAAGVTVRTVKLGNVQQYEYAVADMKADGGPWRTITFNVQAFGKFNTQSPVAQLVASNPQIAALVNVSVTSGIKSGFFQCTPPSESDYAGVCVWVSANPACPAIPANKVYDGVGTVVAINTLGDGVTPLSPNTTYYVCAAAYDTFGQDGMNISTPVSFLANANAPDAGTIQSQMIKDGALTLTKFASGLQPVGIVNGLPVVTGYTGPTIVTNSVDGKLYRLVGGAWTSAVPSTDLSGQLTDAQLATISASKIAGQITDSQIAQLSAAKLAGQITSTQISNSAIGTPQLAAGAVTALNVAAGAITASKLAVIGLGSNLWGDANFNDVASWVQSNWGSLPLQQVVADGQSGSTTMRGGVGGASATGATRVPVAVGKTYRISALVRGSSNANGNLYIRVDAANAATGVSNYGVIGSIEAVVVTTTWTRYSWNWTPTSGQTFAAPMLLLNYGSSTGWMDAQDIRIEEVLPGTLIQDGAITTSKLTVGAVTAATIAAGAITTPALAAGAVTAQILAANSVTANSIAANSITTAAIQTGAVKAAQIDTGAITASKLAVIGLGSNLWGDANFNDVASWVQSNWGSLPLQQVVADGQSGSTTMRGGVGGASATGATRVPVAVGKTYRISALVRGSSNANGNLYIRVDAANAATGVSNYGVIGSIEAVVVTTTWTRYSWNWTPTSGQTFAAPMLLLNYGSSTGWMDAQDIRIEEVLPGTLIQDGAITTSKLTVGAVTADKILANTITSTQIAANTITGGNIAGQTITASNLVAGTITAQQIAAQSITADRLSVASLSAITATIGTLRTATTGARTEISDNLIQIFDSTNVLRVRMGQW